MGSVRAAALAAIAALAGAWACGTAGAFACEDDAQCAGTGALGLCEASGYCSFPDGACPSGRRYGARAPTELADACVEPSDMTTVADDIGDDGDASDDTTTDEPTTASATSLTTTPVDPTSDGEVDTGLATSDVDGDGPASSSSADGDPSDGTTTDEPPPPPCMPVFVDDFDTDTLDPEWESWVSADCSFATAGGHLELSIGASAVEWVSAGLYTAVHSFEGGLTRAQLVPYEPPLDVIGVWLTIFDDGSDCEVQIAAEAEHVMIMVAGTYYDGPAIATDASVWLQLRVDTDDIVHWEYSTDGTAWTEAHSEASPCDFTNARSALFAGGNHDQLAPIVRAVESYERCEAP